MEWNGMKFMKRRSGYRRKVNNKFSGEVERVKR